MYLARIEPEKPGFDLRTFECPRCQHVETAVAQFEWVAQQLNIQNKKGRPEAALLTSCKASRATIIATAEAGVCVFPPAFL
jgi:hypothetical protein